jgi:acyl carrier protein
MDTKETIERFVVDELILGDRRSKIDPDKSLITSGVIDSLGLLRLISFLEGQFGISIKDIEMLPENFETINKIETYVKSKKLVLKV